MKKIFTKNDFKKIILLKKIILKNNLSNKILIYCNNKIKLEIFSKIIIKFLLCSEKKINCECNICKRINNKTYYDLKIKGNFEKIIKKETIEEIIKTFNYSALEQKGIKIYVINGVNLLTIEALNLLLIFLKKPIKNTFAFLLTNNKTKIVNIIKSYCLNINIDNIINLFKSDEFKSKFIINFFKNFVNNSLSNFIYIRKLNSYNNFEYIFFF